MRISDNPANRQRTRPSRWNFQRYLVGGAADPAGLDLQRWRDRIDCLLQHSNRIVALLLAHYLEGAVSNLFRSGLLATLHHFIDKLGYQLAVIDRIGSGLPFLGSCAAGHMNSLGGLDPVLGTGLAAVTDTRGIQSGPDNLVTVSYTHL